MHKIIVLTFIAFTIMFGAFGQHNPVIHSLRNVIHTSDENSIRIQSLNSKCIEYYEHGDYELALQYADSALLLSDRLNYEQGKVIAYYNKGWMYYLKSDFKVAIENSRLAVSIAEEIGDEEGAALAYIDLGYYYFHLGSKAEAEDLYLRSLKISEESGEKAGMAFGYSAIGWFYFLTASYFESLKYYRLCLEISKDINNKPGIVRSYLMLGDIYRTLQKYEDAMRYYDSALKICEEDGDTLGIADSRMKIGRVYQLQGKYAEALEILLGNTDLYKEIGAIGASNQNYLLIGETYYCQKNYAQALSNFLTALRIAEKKGEHPFIAWVKVDLGKTYFDMKDYNNARRYLTEALSILMLLKTIDLLDCVKYLAQLDAAEGKFESATKNYRLYSEIKDSTFSLQNRNNLTQLEIKHETEMKDKVIELLNKDKALREQQLEQQRLVRNGMITGAFLIVLVGLLLFRSFRLRKKLEKQQAVIQERKRISADLHDDVGSGLSRIILLSELERKGAKTTRPSKGVEKIAAISSELASNIDEIVWALNSDNDYVENLVAYIRRYAVEYFENSSVRLIFKAPGKIDHIPISGERRRNIFYTVKEALNNIIKHAHCTETVMRFTVKHDELFVVIQDNGIGFPEGNPDRFGNGLNNMRNRMKSINGSLQVENRAGTKITLSVPV